MATIRRKTCLNSLKLTEGEGYKILSAGKDLFELKESEIRGINKQQFKIYKKRNSCLGLEYQFGLNKNN